MNRRELLALLLATNLLPMRKARAEQPLRQERLLVAGGSGQTGRLVMAAARSAGFAVAGMTTSIARAKAMNMGSEFDWYEVDVRKPETMVAAFEGADVLVSAIGSGRSTREGINPETIDYGGVKNLVDLGVRSNLSQFVLISSAGATIADPEHYFNRLSGNSLIWKFRGEEYLRGSSLAYTIVRPANLNLKSKFYEPGSRGLIFDQGDRVFGTAGAVIHRADLADVCVQALVDRAALHKTFEVWSDPEGDVDQWRKSGFESLQVDPQREVRS